MAKIIFSTISGIPNSNKLPCFYEGMVNALAREGNEVMLMITNNFMESAWKSNKTSKKVEVEFLNRKILDFKPDLVITCNNSLYENIPSLVDCPILVYGTDSPALFIDRDNLSRNASRYDFLMASDDFLPMAKESFGSQMRSLNPLYFATDFISENLEQDKNISFIGTNFTFAAEPFKKIFENDFNQEKRLNFQKFLKSFYGNVLKDPKTHMQELGISDSFLQKISHTDLLNLVSSNFRIQVLQAVSGLGLNLYGSKTWYDVCDSSIDLALSFIDQEVSSVKDNQDIYNSSKISINISHAQAGRAFSWRVRDAMACNTVLVSDPRQDLITQFGKYVKIPTYETPFEAQQLCKKLLQDDGWRREIILASQAAIEEGHRFKHRIKDLEQIFGVNLFEKKGSGKIENLNFYDYSKKNKAFIPLRYSAPHACEEPRPHVKDTCEKNNNMSDKNNVKKIANNAKKMFDRDGKLRSWLRARRRRKKAIKEFKKNLKTHIY